MIEAIRRAGDQWGWLLAVGLAGLALIIAAAADVQPAAEVYELAESPFVGGPCPDGWKGATEAAEHTIVRRCVQGEYLAFLDDQGACERIGRRDEASGYVVEFLPCAEVAAWPAGR